MNSLLSRSFAVSCVALFAITHQEPAYGWGDRGHGIVAAIAYARLNTDTRAEVDALLAEDKSDRLTRPDFISRSTWADKLLQDRETLQKAQYNATRFWHFADIGIDDGNVARACYRFRSLLPRMYASKGPVKDCVVNKVEQFAAELGNPDVDRKEKILALKFLIHLVGDMHQPLHVAGDNDYFGTAVQVRLEPGGSMANLNLHDYWDNELVNRLMASPKETDKSIAQRLSAEFEEIELQRWSEGDPREWTFETVLVAKQVAYDYSNMETVFVVGRPTTLNLTGEYSARALQAAKKQLVKAGVRLARLLNEALP